MWLEVLLAWTCCCFYLWSGEFGVRPDICFLVWIWSPTSLTFVRTYVFLYEYEVGWVRRSSGHTFSNMNFKSGEFDVRPDIRFLVWISSRVSLTFVRTYVFSYEFQVGWVRRSSGHTFSRINFKSGEFDVRPDIRFLVWISSRVSLTFVRTYVFLY